MKCFLIFTAAASIALSAASCDSAPQNQQQANVRETVQTSKPELGSGYENPNLADRQTEKMVTDVNQGKPTPSSKKVEATEAANKQLDVAKPDFRIGIVTDKASTLNCRSHPDASYNNVVKTFVPGDEVGVTGITIFDGSKWYKIADSDCWAIADRITQYVAPQPKETSLEVLPTESYDKPIIVLQDNVKATPAEPVSKKVAPSPVELPKVSIAEEVLAAEVYRKPTPVALPAEPVSESEKLVPLPVETPPAALPTQSSITVTSSGKCNYPGDLDSRGRRCGKRAASVRKGGR